VQAGVASDTLASLSIGVVNVLGTVVAASIIEKSGRTTLLKNSYIGQGLAMFFMAAGFSIPALQVCVGRGAVICAFLRQGSLPGWLQRSSDPGQKHKCRRYIGMAPLRCPRDFPR
jgi:hypothetical protein